ncbi:glycosyltransferase family 1 protein [Acetobacterium bakii]|uniref:glycosyltransferase family 1 protein n=1 Tax=Acetobacterium bakii TaxID=52689 RepID=UPI000682AC2C|nr:glycosyltransferase family 1 protein [Acetobacterium bakii]
MDHKELRVLNITTTYFELDGITNVIMNYYRGMDKSDMIIDLVIPNDIGKALRMELESSGSRIFELRGRTKKPFAYMNELSQIIKENNYDIVHAHGNSCTLALEMVAARRGGAGVRIPHSHNTRNKHKLVHQMLRGVFDANYTNAFACGQKAGEWLFGNKPFEIINNGIDIKKYSYDMEIRRLYRNKYNLNGKKVIGHIGYFSEVKNHGYLIDIFHALYQLDHTYRLILIGDGERRALMEEKVRDLGLADAVIFTGKTLAVPQLLQAMDMMVMPSLFEGFPLTLVEAQTACLPCFASDAVARESAITDLVQFIPLEKTPAEWANIIKASPVINRAEHSQETIPRIIDSGYSIGDNARYLKELYQTFIMSHEKVGATE